MDIKPKRRSVLRLPLRAEDLPQGPDREERFEHEELFERRLLEGACLEESGSMLAPETASHEGKARYDSRPQTLAAGENWPESLHLRCAACPQMVEREPRFVPRFSECVGDEVRFGVEAVTCSYACASRFIVDRFRGEHAMRAQILLCMMCKMQTGCQVSYILPAPSYLELEEYGGAISREEFRARIQKIEPRASQSASPLAKQARTSASSDVHQTIAGQLRRAPAALPRDTNKKTFPETMRARALARMEDETQAACSDGGPPPQSEEEPCRELSGPSGGAEKDVLHPLSRALQETALCDGLEVARTASLRTAEAAQPKRTARSSPAKGRPPAACSASACTKSTASSSPHTRAARDTHSVSNNGRPEKSEASGAAESPEEPPKNNADTSAASRVSSHRPPPEKVLRAEQADHGAPETGSPDEEPALPAGEDPFLGLL